MIFHRAIILDPNFAIDIVNSFVILHNFVLERGGYNTEDILLITGFQSITRTSESLQGELSANNVRKIMMDYFLTPTGSIKWQSGKI